MKKKTKIIILASVLFVIVALLIFVSTWKITVAYTDEDGRVINEEDLGI